MQRISASEEFKDVVLIAPNQRVYMTKHGPRTYKAKFAGPDDRYNKFDSKEKPIKTRSNVLGKWLIFKNGKVIGSYPGDYPVAKYHGKSNILKNSSLPTPPLDRNNYPKH